MDAQAVLRVKPALTQYLHEFDGCIGRITNWRRLQTYVSGQLSDLQRKSIEEIVEALVPAVRTVERVRQRFGKEGFEAGLNPKPRPLRSRRAPLSLQGRQNGSVGFPGAVL